MATPQTPLTQRQEEVLRYIYEHGSAVIPVGGGFWDAGESAAKLVKRIPGPNVTNTVYALEARLLLDRRDQGRMHTHRAPRYLTGRGLDVVMTLGVRKQESPLWLRLHAIFPSYVTPDDADLAPVDLLRMIADRIETDHP